MVEARYALIPDKEKLELHSEQLDPTALSDGQALIRAETTMVSAGTELAAFTALSKNVYIPGRWNSYPFRPGYGLIGRIEALGPREQQLKVGQRVFCFGKHASLQVYDYSGSKPMNAIYPIPDDVDAVKAAVARMVLIGLTAPQLSGAEPGDEVAVFGLGLVGCLAAQLYQLYGARVIGLDTSRGRCAAARDAGLATVLDVAPERQVEAIMELTQGRGARTVVDSVGHTAVIQTALAAAAQYGQVVLLGSPRVPVEGNITEVLNRIHMQSLTVRGALEWQLPRAATRGIRHSVESNLMLALALIRSEKLRVSGLISHVIAPAELGSAYRGMLSDKDAYRGVVVDWR
jgi:2-desacetyl-2-hydroxyethyl bacteriochlorophyllide A dehydrogenase